MGQKELSVLLKIVVAVLAVFLAALLIVFLPLLSREADKALEAGTAAWRLYVYVVPWAVGVSSLPGFAALGLGYRIFTEIGRNNSFCDANAKRLRLVSRLALGDTCLYAVLSVALLVQRTGNLSVSLVFVAVTLFGAAMTVVCAALSHLTQKAADLKSDSDLTI